MAEQRQKLSDTLAYVVTDLHRPEVIEETILGVARRHDALRPPMPAHFGPVGLALVHALNTHMPETRRRQDDGLSECREHGLDGGLHLHLAT